MNKFFYFPFFVIVISFLFSCYSDSKKEEYTEIAKNTTSFVDGYVGDKQCVACHQTEVDQWKGSDHELAMQVANKTTVLGNFNNVKTTIDGVSYFFFKKENAFFVRVKEIDHSEIEYKISYTFGVSTLQQYLIDFDNGKKQVLRVT